jgi:hypothetical protein
MALKLIPSLFTAAGMLLATVITGYKSLDDFSQLRTYSWIGAPPADDPWAGRIIKGVDVQLAAKGWTKIQISGDMVISAFGRTRDAQTVQRYYTGIEGGWKWQGFGDAPAAAENPVGTLLIDIFDGKTKKLIWRGSSTETLSSKPDTSRLEDDITYMFRDFPKVSDK